ncbi:hypothetical protein PENSPDRAFT_692635 [Peniophora sp. CONT]|nr:hypothetical protein PENSPDRAFT_692635 [Peniophora sp. CONT]
MSAHTYGPASYTSSPLARPCTRPSYNDTIFSDALVAGMAGAESGPMGSSPLLAVCRCKATSSYDSSDHDADNTRAILPVGRQWLW